MPCCDNMELEYLEGGLDYIICKNCCAINEEGGYEETQQPKPSSRYKVKHHIAEVLGRLECIEPGRYKLDMNKIKESLHDDYSLANIKKKCKLKHMT